MGVCVTAHPRVSGENADSMASKLGLSGSSPRERGKRDVDTQPAERKRLIPA